MKLADLADGLFDDGLDAWLDKVRRNYKGYIFIDSLILMQN